MLKIVASGIRCVGLAAALMVAPVLGAQATKVTAAAPIPAQIGAARKVFIANDGADLAGQAVFKRAGEPEAAYNHFYAAMQAWGRYELVSTPADADLVS